MAAVASGSGDTPIDSWPVITPPVLAALTMYVASGANTCGVPVIVPVELEKLSPDGKLEGDKV